MADSYTVEYQKPENDEQYKPAPEGLQQVVCVDGIYLGEKVETYPGSPAKLVKKYALVFQTSDVNPATGRRYEIQKEFSITMGPKGNLRKFLSSWRGKTYTDEEAARVELHKTIGVNGLATVEHKTSQAGRLYGVITSIVQLMAGMPKITPLDYERAPYWEERRKDYAADAAAYRRAEANGGVPSPVGSNGNGAKANGDAVPADRPKALVNTPGLVEHALAQAEKNGTSGATAIADTYDGEGDGLPF